MWEEMCPDNFWCEGTETEREGQMGQLEHVTSEEGDCLWGPPEGSHAPVRSPGSLWKTATFILYSQQSFKNHVEAVKGSYTFLCLFYFIIIILFILETSSLNGIYLFINPI